MATAHLELLVEEPSMEAFLSALLPRLLPQDRTFVVHPFQGKSDLLGKLAIEELEAWYFGDWAAVRSAFPRVSANVPRRQGFRNPDAIAGGTWEAFERVMQAHGYFKGGLLKIEAARTIGARVDAARSSSRSFRALSDAIAEACA